MKNEKLFLRDFKSKYICDGINVSFGKTVKQIRSIYDSNLANFI